MKRLKKVLLITLIISFSVVVSFSIGLAFLLEPNINISGFVQLDEQKLENMKKTTEIFSLDGESIETSVTNRKYAKYDDIPKTVFNAFIAIEDKRFYSHHGVDYLRILGAIKTNIIKKSYAEGASTISQQLIKNTHLSSKKTLNRKVQEIRLAKALERNYSKDEILEMYVNALCFGNNIYGIATASEVFFDKSVKNLTLSECATLAGIINSPTYLNPYKYYDKCITRRNTVLERMYEQNMISVSQLTNAKQEKLKLSSKRNSTNQFVCGAINECCDLLGKDKNNFILSEYKIKTYCDEKLQNKLQKLIDEQNLNNADASIMVTDNELGEIKSFVSTSVCDSTALRRMPGSTLKPFATYAPTLEKNLIFSCTKILDEKTNFSGYIPRNYKEKYYGYISAKNALSLSLNIPSVKLLEMVGVNESIKFMRKIGLNDYPVDNPYSLALGNVKNGFTLNELSDAYMTLANYGCYKKSKFVKEIVDKNGNILYKSKSQNTKNVLSSATAFLISDMLHECTIGGTAKIIGYKHRNICAKTGTVGSKNGNTYAYCIAYSPRFTVAVRLNAKSGLMDNKYSGGTLPTKLASKVFDILGDDTKFYLPNDIVFASIDKRAYDEQNAVYLSNENLPEIEKLRMPFSIKNMPRQSDTVAYNQRKSILDDFDNFEIINSVVN